MRASRIAAAALLLGSLAGLAPAQVTVVEDGRWRSAVGLGFSNSTGNTRTSSLTVNADAVRATAEDKWAAFGKGLYARSDGEVSSEQARLGARYDRKLTPRVFAFFGLELERDRLAELSRRSVASSGLGYKLVDETARSFSVFAGLGYTADRYTVEREVDGAQRRRYSYAGLLLGEESTHDFSESVSARQRLVLLPNLRNDGQYRAEFDSSLSVAMTSSLSLNVGFGLRFNSEPGLAQRRVDTLLSTGVAMKFD